MYRAIQYQSLSSVFQRSPRYKQQTVPIYGSQPLPLVVVLQNNNQEFGNSIGKRV